MSSRYEELLARVDELFQQIQNRHGCSMKCATGCHSCCKPGLTVNSLEARHIREGVDPVRAASLLAASRINPFRGKRCSFLQADGGCGIYELRPLVCRSHGAPLQFRNPEDKSENALRFRDVCSLNFDGIDLAALPPGDVMNLDTLNTLMALLVKMEFGESEERIPLSPERLLQG